MKRKLIFLNLALAGLGACAVWQLRVRWLDGRAQEKRVLKQSVVAMPPNPAVPLAAPGPASAGEYNEVAQKTLFSRDRNPDVVVEAVPPRPVPSFPIAYGVLSFGDSTTVMLKEKPEGPTKGYAPGDKVGQFTLTVVENDALVFEWDGKPFRKTFRELKPATQVEAKAAAAPAAGPAAGTAPTVQAAVQSSASSDAGPGGDLSEDLRSCVAGDSTPAGTVRNGYRKVLTAMPGMGQACRWERVK